METLVINVCEAFGVYGISAKDTSIWQTICTSLKQYPEEQPIILDFKMVLLTEAWKNKCFTNILRLPNVVLRVYHSSEMKRDVDAICELCDLGKDRIINIGEVEYVPVVPQTGIKRRIVDKLVNSCTIQGNVLEMAFDKALNSLEKADIVTAMKMALSEVVEANPQVTKMKVDFGRVVINEGVLDTLFLELKPYIFEYDLEFNTVAYVSELKLHMLKHKGNTPEEKMAILKKHLPIDTVVMLTKYAASKNRDNLGRFGNGIADWCHIAIFRGFEGTTMLFDDYTVADFHTLAHKTVESLPQTTIVAEKLRIPVSSMGFWEEFLGSQYHCNYIVQFTPNESVTEWVEVETDRAEKLTLTLPEFAKVVLDDHQISYNKEQLQEATDYTHKLLATQQTI